MNVDVNADVPMPGTLKAVLAYVCFQVVVTVVGGALVAAEIQRVESHGQRLANPGLAYFAGYGSFVLAAALLLAAITVTCGIGWGRSLLVMVEVVAGVNALISVAMGAPMALVGLVLVVLTIGTLTSGAVDAWLAYKEYGRTIKHW